jgi:hypothetical protein
MLRLALPASYVAANTGSAYGSPNTNTVLATMAAPQHARILLSPRLESEPINKMLSASTVPHLVDI